MVAVDQSMPVQEATNLTLLVKRRTRRDGGMIFVDVSHACAKTYFQAFLGAFKDNGTISALSIRNWRMEWLSRIVGRAMGFYKEGLSKEFGRRPTRVWLADGWLLAVGRCRWRKNHDLWMKQKFEGMTRLMADGCWIIVGRCRWRKKKHDPWMKKKFEGMTWLMNGCWLMNWKRTYKGTTWSMMYESMSVGRWRRRYPRRVRLGRNDEEWVVGGGWVAGAAAPSIVRTVLYSNEQNCERQWNQRSQIGKDDY